MARAASSIRRILLVRTDRLGDVILTLPMLSVLRSCFPEARITMLLRRYTGAILEGNPSVDELIWYDDDGGLLPAGAMRRILRAHRFDAAIVVYPTLRLAWLMFAARIPLRIGTGYRWYSFLFNRKVYEHRKDARRHEVEYNLHLLEELGCHVDGPPVFAVAIPDPVRERVRSLLASTGVEPDTTLVVIHPGSGGSAREWRAENFGVVARLLSSEPSVRCIVTGSPGESGKAARVVEASGGAAVSLAGRTSVQELAALLGMSRLFIGNSTGPIHVASAVGTPVVGLYPWQTPMSARRWGPRTPRSVVLSPQHPGECPQCDGTSVCACMESIRVEEVYDAARSLLEVQEAAVPGKGSDGRS